jgi:hypothetical protein
MKSFVKSPGQNLLEFLEGVIANSGGAPPSIIFTGHSLGGALSPTLALAVSDQAREWVNGNSVMISVEPSAGATPGNQDFSEYYGEQLGASTTRLWNNIDVVPHAWNETMLSEIPSLYQPNIRPGFLVRAFVSLARRVSRGGNYIQLLPEVEGLPGEVAQPVPDICASSDLSLLTTASNLSVLSVDEEAALLATLLEAELRADPALKTRLDALLADNAIETSQFQNFESSQATLQQFTLPLVTFFTQVGYQHIDEYPVLLDMVQPYCKLRQVEQTAFRATPSDEIRELKDLAIQLIKTEL